MAMNPMQKKARTSFLLGMFLTLVITGIIIVLLILQLDKIKREQAEIVYKDVYVTTGAIVSGGTVNGNTAIQKVEASVAPNNAVTAANFATYITSATTSKIAIEAGTILTTDMLNVDGKADTSDVRLQEYNMVILPTNLKEGDTIDIRLRLPSGEDYIVLADKYIEKANTNTIWLKVNEIEILTMSNAIVEAYIMEGSLFYATTYTDAGIQEGAIPTYVVSKNVENLIFSDKNVIAIAASALQERYTDAVRNHRNNLIDATLNNFSDSKDSNVQSGVEEEIQKRQSLRRQFVDSLGTK